jgi:hypothetical protein
MNYTKRELIDMIYILGKAEKNTLLAQRIYGMKYPDGCLPPKHSFDDLKERFDERDDLEYMKRKILNSSVTNKEKEMEVLFHIQDNPHISSREMAVLAETSKSSANKITKKYLYHPFHIELHQELHGDYFEKRVNFCNVMLELIASDPTFISKILFTDEATFKSNGTVNRHNMNYYATENPAWVEEVVHQNHWSVRSLNVWCGIFNNKIVGPYFFEEPPNGRNFQHYYSRQIVPSDRRNYV